MMMIIIVIIIMVIASYPVVPPALSALPLVLRRAWWPGGSEHEEHKARWHMRSRWPSPPLHEGREGWDEPPPHNNTWSGKEGVRCHLILNCLKGLPVSCSLLLVTPKLMSRYDPESLSGEVGDRGGPG